MAEFSILQREQALSVFSEIAPQNGQTDMTGVADLPGSVGRFNSFGMVSKDRVIRIC
jgi:hypothetical protein